MEDILIVILCMGTGFFSLICAWKEYDWFMNHRKAWFMNGILGRKGARIFYMGLGLGIIIVSFSMLAAVVAGKGLS